MDLGGEVVPKGYKRRLRLAEGVVDESVGVCIGEPVIVVVCVVFPSLYLFGVFLFARYTRTLPDVSRKRL